MENLSDAEFGSNKDGEEAPILVAQRYLNIFRQVHIFNKEKRDQFDDELLALPTNISDFFKKMPGGRLLVEHIEEVKTERGISFVKSNKDDFTGGYGGDAATAEGTPQMVAGGPIVGGNLVLGESFAETFSKSMAEAFKQLPAPVAGAPIAGGNVSVDLGNAFDVLAEEIRTSRASLLDVLKETRSITDSVIASQVSISRILEGILSARSRDESDVANLNNRIIASQASISKLLEGIYANNNTKLNVSNSSNIDIEARLQEFKQEMKQEIESSINRIQNIVNSFNSNQAKDISANLVDNAQTTYSQSTADINNENINKKKKKKKKKKNRDILDNVSFASSSITDEVMADDFISDEDFSPIDGTIRNAAFKHNDSFDNINLNEPPFEEVNNSIMEEETIDDLDFSLPEESFADDNLDDEIPMPIEEEGLDSFDDDDLDFTLPQQELSNNNETTQDYLNNSNASDSIFDNSEDNSNFDFTTTNENTSDSIDNSFSFNDMLSNLSDDITDEGIDTNDELLATDSISFNEVDTLNDFSETSYDKETSLSFDTINENIDNDLEFLQKTDESLTSFDNLSDFEDINLEQSNQENANISLEETSFDNDFDTLNLTEEENLTPNNNEIIFDESDITSYNDDNAEDDNLDRFDFSAVAIEEDSDNAEYVNINESLDGIVSDFDNTASISDEVQNFDEIITENTATQSRYSAELDKIREALTGDSVDLSSLDEPIALDEYSDDENLEEEYTSQDNQDDEWEYEYVEDAPQAPSEITADNENTSTESATEEEWEWEYVDEEGNPLEASGDEDWEWEYVEEDEESDNKEE